MSSPQNAPGTTVCRGDYLIPDVLISCFDHVDLNDLLRCMKTCHRWRVIARDHPTFSRDVFLYGLAPSSYQRFLAQILHKDGTQGSLRVKLSLQEHETVPRKLREMLKRVWPRMERFGIQTMDTASALAILSLPSPRLEVLELMVKDVDHSPPTLTPDFLGGQAPVLRAFMTLWVALPSERVPALEGLGSLSATAFHLDSLRNVTTQCPRLRTFEIIDPVVADRLDEHDVAALKSLSRIGYIILRYRLRPQWAEYLIDALPLSDIRHIFVFISQDDHRPTIPVKKLYDVIESIPGDMTVDVFTALSPEPSALEHDFVAIGKDAEGRTFRRDISLGKYLPRFRIPESICMRIVGLTIHAPDWDKTCFWMYGLQRLDVLQLVFRDKAVFEDLIRPERKFKRKPVPVSYLGTVRWILATEDGAKHDADFGVLHSFLRKGTMEPCIPLSDQNTSFAGLRVTGEAKITLPGTEETIFRGLNFAPRLEPSRKQFPLRPSAPK
ncbi:hypothetical protein AURDEDRAFT_171889 [Auricularia subglabra TFB-10046 SS5]|uniref:F-box domain-containing protein n=1 Tax=Auricularia subglabra (strain TFB-10046 / SS5) TaxID=717982 RepID=J0LIN4_AURST|nr:hypothetical protein AURDEDRAFT_171889 [Auricularia subglabra TFB-10046 SS5]